MADEIEADELTPEEADAVQQMRNSGLTPQEVVKRAMQSTQKAAAAPAETPLTPMQQRQTELLVEGSVRRRELTDTVREVVKGYESLDATDLEQINLTVAKAVGTDPEYAKWSYEQTKEKLREKTKAECERRLGKAGASKSTDKETVEKRLAKEDAAVGSGSGGSRSAEPAHETDEDDFDGSLCGTGDEKAFAMTDAELTARYSGKAQKFLKKERGQKV